MLSETHKEIKMSKLLNITENDRIGCKVVYNVNRFEVYHANGWMLTAAINKDDLKKQLSENGIKNAMFDSHALQKYLGWVN